MPDTHLPVEKLRELVRRHYAVWSAERAALPAATTALADCLIALKHNEEFWRELKELITTPQLAGKWDSVRAGLPESPNGMSGLAALVEAASLDPESRATVLAGLRGTWQREDQIRAAFAQERPQEIAQSLQELVDNSKPHRLADRLWLRLQSATRAIPNKLMVIQGLFIGLIIMWLIIVLMSMTSGEPVSNNFKYKGVTPEPETA